MKFAKSWIDQQTQPLMQGFFTMEPLFQREDGYSETGSGLFAVAPLAVSGTTVDGETKFFEFRPAMLAQVVRVEWPASSPLMLIPEATARTMRAKGYVRLPTAAELDSYSEAYNAYAKLTGNPTHPSPVAAPVAAPVTAQLAPAAPTVPAPIVQETPAPAPVAGEVAPAPAPAPTPLAPVAETGDVAPVAPLQSNGPTWAAPQKKK